MPKQKWIGLATSVLGFTQVVGHGVVFPDRAREYSPGAATAILLHGPIGAAWIRHQHQLRHGGLTRADLAGAAVLIAVFVAGGVIWPQ